MTKIKSKIFCLILMTLLASVTSWKCYLKSEVNVCETSGKLITVNQRQLSEPYLKIIGKNITFIPDKAFNNLTIERLTLDLTDGKLEVRPSSFSGLPQLERLIIKSGIITLQSNLFQELKNLHELKLIVDNVEDGPVPILSELKELKKLTIFNSNLTNIRDSFFSKFNSTIETLVLENNGITIIENGTFPKFKHLRQLKLYESNLTHIPSISVFDDLDNLTSLEIGNGKLKIIPENSFNGWSHLREIFLLSDEIEKIEVDAFLGLRIVDLSLMANKLNNFEIGVFNGLSALERLSLRANKIEKIQKYIFNDLWNLGELDFSMNNISEIEVDAFFGMNINTLLLDVNNLTYLKPGTFGGLEQLSTLYLNSNKLVKIPKGLFNHLKHIDELDLSMNKISEIEEFAFSGMNIVQLSMKFNKLKYLKPNMFSGLENLEKLDLSQNKIETIPVNIFDGLPKLGILKLSWNKIAKIETNAFSGTNIQEIYLLWNDLKVLEPGMFRGMQNLTDVHFYPTEK